MFFDSESFAVKFIAIYLLDQKDVRQYMYKRKFCTIALRIKSDAVLTWNNKTQNFTDKMISFVPQNLDYSRFAKYDNMIAINFETYNYISQNIVAVVPKNFDSLMELFQKALYCWNKREPGYQYRCTAILCEIFAMLQSENSNQTDLIPQIIENSITYMNEHYTDPDCTVQKLADISHISLTYFRKIFEKTYAISPKKFINTLRIEHAARLLSSSSLAISDISEQAGFNDPKYFATMFKAFYGTNPSLFRKEDALSNKIELLKDSPKL